MTSLKYLAAAGLLAATLALPQSAAATLIDEDITVTFDWTDFTTPTTDTETLDTTGGTVTRTDGDGSPFDDYFAPGDAFSIGSDTIGDFFSFTVGTVFASNVTVTLSGWEETLLSVTDASGTDFSGVSNVQNESLSASAWSATLVFDAGTTTDFYFNFQDSTGGGGDDGANVVPLPAGAWLMLTAFGGLAFARRRRA